MYETMNRLISIKYYATAKEAKEKLNVFYAMGELTTDEFTSLMAMVDDVYGKE